MLKIEANGNGNYYAELCNGIQIPKRMEEEARRRVLENERVGGIYTALIWKT
jgi:hypothetical protein